MQHAMQQPTWTQVAARWFSIALICIVLAHGVIMAMNPHDAHAGARDAIAEVPQGLTCDVQNSVSVPPNPGLESPPQADVPASIAILAIPVAVDACLDWREPAMNAASIRLLHQIFLN